MSAVHATPAEQRLLLDLADVDADLLRARTLRDAARANATSTIPDADPVQSLRDDLVRARMTATDLDAEAATLAKEQRLIELRLADDRAALEAGTGSTAQRRDLDHDLRRSERRVRELAADAEELSAQREATALEIERLREQVAVEEQRVSAGLDGAEERRRALADAEERCTYLENCRTETLAALPERLSELYCRQREGDEGVGLGAARLVGSWCDACGTQLAVIDVSALRGAPEDELVRCPECTTWLVRGAAPRQ